MDIIEAIRTRRSIRTYDGIPVDQEIVSKLEDFIKNLSNPFGGEIEIKAARFELKGEFKPSTYGVIRGAADYFLMGYGNSKKDELSAGFCFEQVVLEATRLGLGTCWIAATFKGSDFDRKGFSDSNLKLKIVSPFGYSSRRSIIEKLSGALLGSTKRKPFSELFFNKNTGTPLSDSESFSFPLELMRLAPSSTNSQPWRAIVCNSNVHFFYLHKSKLSIVDCGIGLCHFIEGEKDKGHKGRFFEEENLPPTPEKWHYLVSYLRE